MKIQTISPCELDDRVVHGDQVELIDVRAPAEFREMCAKSLAVCRSPRSIRKKSWPSEMKRLASHSM